jgi:hypothetical protein
MDNLGRPAATTKILVIMGGRRLREMDVKTEALAGGMQLPLWPQAKECVLSLEPREDRTRTLL